MTADSESRKQTIYVIKGLNSCLLGFPAINTLHLLQRIEPVAEKEPCIKARFKCVFTGLGTIEVEYRIYLKEGGKPYSLHSPRNVPIPLRSKVEEELNHMEEMGIIRELLSSKRTWIWGSSQEKAFCKLKDELVKPTVLALYNPQAEGKISADASSFGIGAVFLQKFDQAWRPVAYISRAMLEAEKRYAQIEKEALALT